MASSCGRTEGISIVARFAPFAGRATEAVEHTLTRRCRSVERDGLRPIGRSPLHRFGAGRNQKRPPSHVVFRRRAHPMGDKRCPGEIEPGFSLLHALAVFAAPLDSLAPDRRVVRAVATPRGRAIELPREIDRGLVVENPRRK